MTSFPILGLPFVAMQNVMEFMDLMEIVKLSICNKKLLPAATRAKRIISFGKMTEDFKQSLDSTELFQILRLKSGYKKIIGDFISENSLTFVITIANECSIRIDSGNSRWDLFSEDVNCQNEYSGALRCLELGGSVVHFKDSGNYKSHFFFKEKSSGIMSLLSFFTSNMGISIDSLYIQPGSHHSENFQSSLKLLIHHPITVIKLVFHDIYGVLDHKNYTSILNGVTVSKEYLMWLKNVEPFQVIRPIQAEMFTSLDSSWITFDTFSEMNCPYIRIEKSTFTNEQLKEFMSNWMNGKYPRLKHLEVQLPFLNTPFILDGFPIQSREGRIKEEFHTCKDHSLEVSNRDVDLQNKNGLTGTVLNPKVVGKHHKFQFVVWQ